jgi:hypothetical protein
MTWYVCARGALVWFWFLCVFVCVHSFLFEQLEDLYTKLDKHIGYDELAGEETLETVEMRLPDLPDGDRGPSTCPPACPPARLPACPPARLPG